MSDPVRQCLSTGGRVHLGRHGMVVSSNGEGERSIELTVTPSRDADGELSGTVVALRDVSDLRGLTRQMSYQASHDALTGLVNRREFEVRLQEALESAHSGGHRHALCYLDLDRFKAVNDECGHMAGDNMLREVAALLKDAVRDSDTVGRLGGDEFGILLVGCPLEKARQIADDVVRALPLAYAPSTAEYRGSLVELTPGTTYDIELTLSGVGQAVFQAATRSETFPIAQTVELPELSSATLTITQGGTPDGYVLYTNAPGASATIDVQDLWDYGVVIKASYVILRGVNVRGAHKYAVYIPNTGVYTDVVIEENDISGWGAWEGAFGASAQAGIRGKNPDVRRLVIQRNRIHHRRVAANSWCENRDGTPDPLCDTNPSGPTAIRIVDTGGNHVIRYVERGPGGADIGLRLLQRCVRFVIGLLAHRLDLHQYGVAPGLQPRCEQIRFGARQIGPCAVEGA